MLLINSNIFQNLHLFSRKILPYTTYLPNLKPYIFNFSRTLTSSQQINNNSITQISENKSFKRFKVIDRIKKDKIQQIPIDGSFVRLLLLYNFEDKIFELPNIFKDEELLTLKFRNDYILDNFHEIIENDNLLKDLGFFNLSQLTVHEIIYIFEAIGRNISIKISDINISEYLNKDFEGKVNQLEKYPSLNSDVLKALMKLIMKNFLGPSQREENLEKQTRFGELLSQNKIGFAWNDSKGNYCDDIKKWSTTASLSSDKQSWILNGSKRGILKDNYDYYFVFAKTDDFLTKFFFFDDNQAIDFLSAGLVGLLVPANLVTEVTDDTTITGIEYQKISFNYLDIKKDICEIIKPSLFECFNQKGIALLSISSFILGQLKLLIEECYNYYREQNITFTKGIENKLCEITCLIYTLESCLLLTAKIYDQMNEINNFPEMYYESCICKIIAIDCAKKALYNLQACYGLKPIIISPLIEFIDHLDNFLGNSEELLRFIGESCSNDFCLHLRSSGFIPKNISESQFSKLDYFLEKEKIKSTKNLFFNPVKSYSFNEKIHLQTDAFLYSLSNIYDVIEMIVSKWLTSPEPRSFYEEYRIANIAVQLYINASLISRLNTALKLNHSDASIDLLMFSLIGEKVSLKAINWSDELERSDYDTNGGRYHFLHYTNAKLNGFFAPHPLYELW